MDMLLERFTCYSELLDFIHAILIKSSTNHINTVCLNCQTFKCAEET